MSKPLELAGSEIATSFVSHSRAQCFSADLDLQLYRLCQAWWPRLSYPINCHPFAFALIVGALNAKIEINHCSIRNIFQHVKGHVFLSGQKVILCAILNFAVAIFWHTVRNRKPRC